MPYNGHVIRVYITACHDAMRWLLIVFGQSLVIHHYLVIKMN